jgi:hypothetical protein
MEGLQALIVGKPYLGITSCLPVIREIGLARDNDRLVFSQEKRAGRSIQMYSGCTRRNGFDFANHQGQTMHWVGRLGQFGGR